MIPLVLSFLALSSPPVPPSSASSATSCTYVFDITRAQEPAPPGCPAASWSTGSYDATDPQPLGSTGGAALQASRSIPAPGDSSAWI